MVPQPNTKPAIPDQTLAVVAGMAFVAGLGFLITGSTGLGVVVLVVSALLGLVWIARGRKGRGGPA